MNLLLRHLFTRVRGSDNARKHGIGRSAGQIGARSRTAYCHSCKHRHSQSEPIVILFANVLFGVGVQRR